MEVTKQDGTTAEVPDGIVCWPCGSTCTVWPNMLMHIIADKLKDANIELKDMAHKFAKFRKRYPTHGLTSDWTSLQVERCTNIANVPLIFST